MFDFLHHSCYLLCFHKRPRLDAHFCALYTVIADGIVELWVLRERDQKTFLFQIQSKVRLSAYCVLSPFH